MLRSQRRGRLPAHRARTARVTPPARRSTMSAKARTGAEGRGLEGCHGRRMAGLAAGQLQRQQDDRPCGRLLGPGRLDESCRADQHDDVLAVWSSELQRSGLERNCVGHAGNRHWEFAGEACGHLPPVHDQPHSDPCHQCPGQSHTDHRGRGLGPLTLVSRDHAYPRRTSRQSRPPPRHPVPGISVRAG